MNLINRDKLIPHCSCGEECMADREKCKKCCDYVVNFEDIQEEPIVNAIEIPDGATNGDMIKIIWNPKEIEEMPSSYVIKYMISENDFSFMFFNKTWWNSLYKEVL